MPSSVSRHVEPAPPGARESNAGDEFHVLWAINRSLRMLDPKHDLHRIVMESVSPLDEVAKNPAMLLGVDLTEYFGGDRFSTASKTIISQLKYSHRHPHKAWTAARLCRAGSSTQTSVFRRLAEAYQIHLADHGREPTVEKLRLRVVSNQPAAPKLESVLTKTKFFLATKSSRVFLRTLCRELNAAESAEVHRLHSASGLTELDFSDLLRTFDIEYLGAGSRVAQEQQIATTLSKHLITDLSGPMNSLYRRFYKEAMPEGEGSLGLNRADLLAEVGAVSEAAIFPLPSRYSEIEDPLITPDVEAVAVALAGATRVVAHGAAGVGKTTMLGQLESRLPAGSTVVRYDCFGGGEYLSPSEQRHAVGPALLQIINMIAVATGTPLLLRGADEFYLWRHLEHTLSLASEAVSGTDALLVLAIDAADNAAVAGQVRSTQTFLPDLWRLSLPDNVRLLMTSRTHRVPSISASDDAVQLRLVGFDLPATSQHLRQRFDATAAQCSEFHDRSSGNPRTQFYVLDRSRPGAPNTLNEAIAIADKTPETIFADLVKAATMEVSNPDEAHRHLADLICLTRPLTLEQYAEAIGESVAKAARFCEGMMPGVEVETGFIAFRDEDFETYVRTQVSGDETGASHRRLGARMLDRQGSNAYAATACAEHLRLGGLDSELIDLAVREPQPEIIKDPVERSQTYFRRIELAMSVAVRPDVRQHTIPLVLLAAKAAATNDAVRTIIRQSPDLAMRYADNASVVRVINEEENAPWRGQQHFQLAGLYSQVGELSLATEQFDLAMAWVRRRSELPANDTHDWRLEAKDVAAGLRLILKIHGPQVVLQELLRWRPISFRLQVAEALVASLALQGRESLIGELTDLGLPHWLQAQLLSVACAHGSEVDGLTITAIARSAIANPPNEIRRRGHWTVDYAELISSKTHDAELLRQWFAVFAPVKPAHAPMRWNGLGEWTPTVRKLALEAALAGRDLSEQEVVPESWRADPADGDATGRRQKDVEQLQEALGQELPILTLRANTMLGNETVDELSDLVESRRLTSTTGFAHEPPVSRRLLHALEACLACESDLSGLVRSLGIAARTHDGPSFHESSIALARAVVLDARYRDCGLVWLDEVALATSSSNEPAGERADRLLELSAIAQPFDEEAARSYFLLAVEAADGLDNEGAAVLHVHADLAERCGHLPGAARRKIAERLARSLEQYQPFVSDDSYLPWKETISAVTGLDPPSGIALMSRWDREDRFELSWSVDTVAPKSAANGYLTPIEAMNLLVLAGVDDFSYSIALDLLDQALDTSPRPSAKQRSLIVEGVDRMADQLCRNAKPATRQSQAGRINQWARERSLRSSTLDELGNLAEYVSALPEKTENEGASRYWLQRDERVQDFLDRVHPIGVSDLADALDELAELTPSEGQLSSFLEYVGKTVPPGDRLAVLETLADLPSDRGLWRSRPGTLIGCIGSLTDQWITRREIAEWLQDRFPKVIEERFTELIRFHYDFDSTLEVLRQAELVDDFSELILRSAGPHISALSPRQLHVIARLLGRSTDEDSRASALDWSLARFEDGDRPLVPEFGSVSEVVGQLLWASFGQPRKSNRWSAAHAARALLPALPEALTALVSHTETREAGPFAPEGIEFCWMSAWQWTMLLVARLADENPSLLLPHRDWLLETATSQSFPHASIRELARRSLLRMQHNGDLTLTALEFEELTHSNTPLHSQLEAHRARQDPRAEPEPGLRYHFDSLDTMPYWYEPFGRIFDLSAAEVAKKAERWIVDVLGFDNASAMRETHAVRDESSWPDYRNDHGSSPRVEIFNTYLEYHAMLLVAGELLDEKSPVVRRSYDGEDAWHDWLEEHIDMSPECWTADRRAPAPLEPWAYDHVAPREDWRKRGQADFDAELCLEGGAIVVDSRVEVAATDRYSTAWISSALVSPDTGLALLRALQTCEDPTDFRLPGEPAGPYPDDMEINEPGFALTGWIIDGPVPDPGLEQHDQLRRIDGRVILPGKRFRDHCQVNLSMDSTTLTGEDGPVAWMKHWSDERSSTSHAEPHSSGHRTIVDVEVLLSFLVETEMDLIFEVRLERQFSSTSPLRNLAKEEERYERGESRIYLLRGTGWLETLAGSRRIG